MQRARCEKVRKFESLQVMKRSEVQWCEVNAFRKKVKLRNERKKVAELTEAYRIVTSFKAGAD